jgi:hypothetical protein
VIPLPHSVEILGKSCFANARIGNIGFEASSCLTRFDESSFRECSLRLAYIPCSVRTIGEFWPASITPVFVGPPMADPTETRRKQDLAGQSIVILSKKNPANLGLR